MLINKPKGRNSKWQNSVPNAALRSKRARPSVPRAERRLPPKRSPKRLRRHRQRHSQQTYTPSAPAAQPVSTAYYFWMMLLFAIPVIGLIVCLVTAFSGEDASRKNFSRAALIWIVVGVVLAVVAVVALALLSNAAMPIIRSSFDGIM